MAELALVDNETSIDELRIVTALEANIVEADTIQGSEISEQRQRNHIHYALDRVGNEKKGRSQHISADVLDAVESQKALYLESTQSNQSSVVRFLPEYDGDTTSDLATQYVNVQLFEKNKGYRFIRDSLHDAFIAKRCVAKVEWIEDEEITEERFKGFPQQVAELAKRDDIFIKEARRLTVHDDTKNSVEVIEGTAYRMKDTSRVHICPIQPERFFRDPNVAYIGPECAFAGFQADLPRYQLIDMGFDPDQVLNLDLDYRFRQNEEDAARKAHDSTWSRARRHKREPEQEIVTVYWHWAYLDLTSFTSGAVRDRIEDTKLYKFVWSQGELLTIPESGEKWQVAEDGYPFVEWTQYKIAHSEFGLCEADIMGPIQWSKTNILNLSIDNVAMNNTSRWKARHGFIKNPRELLDNNIGGVLWMRDLNALEPLPTAPLAPHTMQVYEALDIDKENRNGMSRLSKGLNTDAIRYQNADDMVERLTNASNRRVMRGVRDFCEEFLVEIAMKVYKLGRKYDTQTHTVEIKGEWMSITAQDLPERSKTKVKAALTPDETMKAATFLLQMYQLQAADPQLQMMFGAPQKHAMLDDVYDLMGWGDSTRYMLQPDDPKVLEQIQMQMQQTQALQQQEQAMTDLQVQLLQKEDQRADLETQLKVAQQQLEEQDMLLKQLDVAADNQREDDKFELERWKTEHEIQIEHQQERPAAIR